MRNIIQPGELDDFLIIQKKTSDIDENGFPSEAISTVYELDCKVKTVSGKEAIENDRLGSSMIYKFIVPREEVKIDSRAMFILYDNEEFDIKHVHHIDDFYYELTAELRK
jgi:head-tail adaptor